MFNSEEVSAFARRSDSEAGESLAAARPPLSVVIDLVKTGGLSRESAQALAAQSLPLNRCELLFIVTSSQIPEVEAFSEACSLSLVTAVLVADREGIVEGWNRALNAAKGEVILFLTGAAIPGRNAFASHITAHREHRGAPAIVRGERSVIAASPNNVFAHIFNTAFLRVAPLDGAPRLAPTESEGLALASLTNVSFQRSMIEGGRLWFHQELTTPRIAGAECEYRLKKAGADIKERPIGCAEYIPLATIASVREDCYLQYLDACRSIPLHPELWTQLFGDCSTKAEALTRARAYLDQHAGQVAGVEYAIDKLRNTLSSQASGLPPEYFESAAAAIENGLRMITAYERYRAAADVLSTPSDAFDTYFETKKPEPVLKRERTWAETKQFVLDALRAQLRTPYDVAKALIPSLAAIAHVLRSPARKYYNGFAFHFCANFYFYQVLLHNVRKFGRFGVSTLLGSGKQNLGTQFQVCPVSYEIANFLGGCATATTGMAVWLLAIAAGAESPALYIMFVLFAIVFSSAFYMNLYRQNYNVLAWMVLPVALAALFESNGATLLVTGLWIAACSFTAFFTVAVFAGAAFLATFDLDIVFALLPGAIVSGYPVLRTILGGTLHVIAGSVGLKRSGKYKYAIDRVPDAAGVYMHGIWAAPAVVYALRYGFDLQLVFLLIPILLSLTNNYIARFADLQSLVIIFASAAAVVLCRTDVDPLLFLAFAFSINRPWCLWQRVEWSVLENRPPVLTPTDARPMLEAFSAYFAPLPAGSRVWLSFENPRGDYSQMFDGFHDWLHPLEYVAHTKDIYLFPDFFYLFEFNRPEDPDDIWGRDLQDAVNAAKTYGADFVQIYRKSNGLDRRWQEAGLEVVSCCELDKIYNGDIGHTSGGVFFLLRVTKAISEQGAAQ